MVPAVPGEVADAQVNARRLVAGRTCAHERHLLLRQRYGAGLHIGGHEHAAWVVVTDEGQAGRGQRQRRHVGVSRVRASRSLTATPTPADPSSGCRSPPACEPGRGPSRRLGGSDAVAGRPQVRGRHGRPGGLGIAPGRDDQGAGNARVRRACRAAGRSHIGAAGKAQAADGRRPVGPKQCVDKAGQVWQCSCRRLCVGVRVAPGAYAARRRRAVGSKRQTATASCSQSERVRIFDGHFRRVGVSRAEEEANRRQHQFAAAVQVERARPDSGSAGSAGAGTHNGASSPRRMRAALDGSGRELPGDAARPSTVRRAPPISAPSPKGVEPPRTRSRPTDRRVSFTAPLPRRNNCGTCPRGRSRAGARPCWGSSGRGRCA